MLAAAAATVDRSLLLLRFAATLGKQQPGAGNGGSWRTVSSSTRKRRSVYYKAMADPNSHPGTLKKLREGAASPPVDLLRYLAENKVGKAVTQADRRNLWFTLQFKRFAPRFLGQMKPRMTFWTAALDEEQLPLARLPEVAIAGRSNSGKSTLVNYLCGRHSAHVKREPGSTRELVFWSIGRPAQLCLVDLPGYGFANAPEEQRLQWTEFALWYIRSRKNLKRVLLMIDARAGLKPADKEMIAYLERHRVPWQIIVSKCDTVKRKDLARKITILEEDVKSYPKMAGPPIPISALKKMGMDELREQIDGLKINKEVVKEGIRMRCYDLMEQRRIRKAEKNRKRRQRKREAEEEAEAVAAMEEQQAAMTPGLADAGETKGSSSSKAAEPNLHDILGREEDGGDDEIMEDGSQASGASQKLRVTEARYSLDDRDSLRIEGLMSGLFPDLPDIPSSDRAEDCPSGPAQQPVEALDDVSNDMPLGTVSPYFTEEPPEGASSYFTTETSLEDEGSDSESEWEEINISQSKPSVMRFEPSFQHGRGAPYDAEMMQDGPYQTDHGASGLGSPEQGSQHQQQITLRQGWARPPGNVDRVYERDDFASPEDHAAGLRKFATAAPTAANAGQLMSEARKKYEREWATELESVEGVRTRLSSTEGGRPEGHVARASSSSSMHVHVPRAERKPGAARLAAEAEAAVERKRVRPAYITKGGLKELRTGRGAWRVVGRPPAKILKSKQVKDAAKQFNLRDEKGRKRNLGTGLSWSEAKTHWINWFRKHKGPNIQRVLQADSPKQADVVADFEERAQKAARRWGNSDSLNGQGQRPLARTGPGGAALDLQQGGELSSWPRGGR